MLNGRIYRAACLPLLLALVIAGVSFGSRPAPLTSNLSPDAFDGAQTTEELAHLAGEFPDRHPGSDADKRLAAYIAQKITALGGPSSGGFRVSTRRFQGQTTEGQRTLTNVIARRPGSSDANPIVIIAHRDAVGRGAQAELSATAVLLELARVFASRETSHPIILASTSGGSGGDAGVIDLANHLARPIDAAIVLGDLASVDVHRPFVIPSSESLGGAPAQLVGTVEHSIMAQVGTEPGGQGIFDQFAHLAFPLAVGEQGPLIAAGIPAVLVQVSGEQGPSPNAPVSATRVENFGRAVLDAVDAIDGGPEISSASQSLQIHKETIPSWSVRLLVGALILPVLILALDALARVRRRREPVGLWSLWTLSCAGPFFASAVLVFLLARLGVPNGSPSAPVLARAMPVDGAAKALLVVLLLLLLLMWLCWPFLTRRLGLQKRPDGAGAGVAVLLVLTATAVLVWIANPFAALLLILPLHLFLFVLAPELRPRRWLGLAVIALALVPAGLLVFFYAHEFAAGPTGVVWAVVLQLGGGHLGFLAALLASLFLGCVSASILVALQGKTSTGLPQAVSIRGPISYAGPGSLGGTESALRR